MKSAIEELIFENIPFMESIKPNDEYQQLLQENDKIYRQLKLTLNGEQLKLLDQLIDNHMVLEAEATDSYLLKGFKTGLNLIIECL